MTNRFTPDPDKTRLGRCDNCNTIFWIRDTISLPSGVYCSEECGNVETCHKAERNRIPSPMKIKMLVKHEDEWAKRGIMALGKALLKGGSLHQKFSVDATYDIVSLYDLVSKYSWTPNGVSKAKQMLPKYSGDLWELACLKRHERDTARGQTA